MCTFIKFGVQLDTCQCFFGVQMDSFGERLRSERERLGLTQDEFSEKGGVKKRAQINYEKGERNPDSTYLAAIAAAGVDIVYVITGVRTTPAAALSPRAAALVDNFEHMADEDKRAIERLADAVQKPQAQGLTGTK
ncbi:helix-turn-helix domain-containing protein [Cellvibrio mixtus]|uniref:helix-turn-helix domain-containing protein n=1 Tax=Cellvibrio mixtus TaxID=39650 RepID=UPI00190F2A59|nr:helix-turn-helix transcriptional regulator [Cellvibrio mixtus]